MDLGSDNAHVQGDILLVRVQHIVSLQRSFSVPFSLADSCLASSEWLSIFGKCLHIFCTQLDMSNVAVIHSHNIATVEVIATKT